MKIERETCSRATPGARACSAASWRDQPQHRATTSWPLADDEIVGYAGLVAAAGPGGRADHRGRWRDQQRHRASARAARPTLLAEARTARRTRGPAGGARGQRAGAGAVRRRSGSSAIGVRRGYYQPGRRRGHAMKKDAAACADEPLVLGIETSCDETGVGHRPRAHPARRRGRLQRRRARPLRRRGARGRQPGAPGGDGADRASGRWTTPGVRLADIDAIAVTAGPGPGRRAAGRRRRGQGVRARARQAAVRRQPPGRARRRRPAGARPAARAVRSRCWSPAGTRSLLLVPDVAADVDRWARPSTTRRARRSTRSPGVLGLPFPGGPLIDRAAREGDPDGDRVPARADRPATTRTLRLLVLRAEDRRRPLGRGARSGRRAGAGAPTWRRPSRRRSSTC